MEEKKEQTETMDINTEGQEDEQQPEEEVTDTVEQDETTLEDTHIQSLEQEIEETKNRLLRTQADYDNFRRRTREEREAAAKYRAQGLVEELLPVLDNFERALSAQTNDEQSKSLVQGLQMVYNQLVEALRKEGAEEIKAEKELFDPHLHQAVMQVQSDDHDDNVVVEVLQKGYQLKDRVIRPAMVKVNAKQ
ncbi:nucleotide exchange factor GrpE [Pseudalkalibacillus decolorationis]|uniref:nucleotide exchange factor GrpE n=1 Tax=Pseudalkalibacillus decolorationis TaxID=163879 RepID=UPI00214767E0|nr:nucleotide exchange factor GrpE [Pseudalkalibacillus decolorationis]